MVSQTLPPPEALILSETRKEEKAPPKRGWRDRFDHRALGAITPAVALIGNPTDPKIDHWLRRQPPRVELALRYSIRGRFRNFGDHRAFNARIDELFALLRPGENELAAIMRHARAIGAAMEGHLAEPARRAT